MAGEFTRKYLKIPIDNGTVRHKIRIEDNIETVQGSPEARGRFIRLCELLATTPDLSTCGEATVCDWTLFRHDGAHWTVEMEALVSGR